MIDLERNLSQYRLRVNRWNFFLFFFLLVNLYCSNTEPSSRRSAQAAGAIKETGENGCSVSGINNQIVAGYTRVTQTSTTVRFQKATNRHYAVVQVTGALAGTKVQFNKSIKPNIFLSSSCPLKLDSDILAKSGSDYNLSEPNNQSEINILKAANYLIYFNIEVEPESFGLTVISGGTPLQSSDSASAISGILNGTTNNTTPSFQFACSSSTGACANYFLTASSVTTITTCSLGPTSSTKQSTKCDETAILASCKQSLVGVGTIITLYKSPATTTTANSLCSAASGTYLEGSTIPSP